MSASAAPWLFQLYAAEGAAVILSAPDIMVQPDKTGIPGKPMRLAVELYQMLVQIQCLADDVVSNKYGYRKENSTNFNNAIQRFFPIVRKRPSDGSGGPTTMLVGCRFLKHENGEQDHAATEDEGAFS